MIPLGSTDNKFANYNLTDDQQKAVSGIIDFIAEDFNPDKFCVALVGAGGVGKTYSTRFIAYHCKYSLSVLKFTAPTHKACRVLSEALGGFKVETIQSTFGLRLDTSIEDFDYNNPPFNPKGKIKLDNIKILFIDESSMLNAGLVRFILEECCKREIKVCFSGDASQLAPVKERTSTAFTKCFKVYTLNQIVRQKKENPLSQLLALLRDDIKNKTYNFIKYISQERYKYHYNEEGEGFYICGLDDFKKQIEVNFHDENYTKDISLYKIVAYTNKRVNDWNNFVRNSIIRNADKAIITKNDLFMAYDTIVDRFLCNVLVNSEEYIVKDIVNYTDDKYGFKGYLTKFQAIQGGHITNPIFIIDHTDGFTLEQYYKTIRDLVNTAIKHKAWGKYYNFKKEYILLTNIVDQRGKILVNRTIDYGFALTSHKSQGSTYTNVFVDANDMIYDLNGKPYTDYDDMLRRLYVACSRAKNQLIICYG